jgi:hypothetical protein
MDVSTLGWKHFYKPGKEYFILKLNMEALDLLKETSALDEKHYPELLRNMYVINAPGIVSMFWKIISRWLDPKTRAKVNI